MSKALAYLQNRRRVKSQDEEGLDPNPRLENGIPPYLAKRRVIRQNEECLDPNSRLENGVLASPTKKKKKKKEEKCSSNSGWDYREELDDSIDRINDDKNSQLISNIPTEMRHYPLDLPARYPNMSVFFGHKEKPWNPAYIGKPLDQEGHVLVVGGAGSGKTSGFVIPTLRNRTDPFVAIDIKGDLYENLSNISRPCKVFAFSDSKEYFRYDPFYLLRNGSPNDLVQNARELAQAIISIAINVYEPFWLKAAQNILTAAILHVYGTEEKSQETGEVLRGTFNQVADMLQEKPIGEVIDTIERGGNEDAKKFINNFLDVEDPEANKMILGIFQELSNFIVPFATDNRIRAAFTPEEGNTMRWEDLETHNIYLQIPEDKLGQWDGAITLMLTQLIRTLERRPDKHARADEAKKLPPVLLMFDEFPRLGKLNVIQNAVSTLRSKNVTICLIIQSLAQLDNVYGKEVRQVILDNCPYKAILSVTDPENQEIFSKMIGSIDVERKSFSFAQKEAEENPENITVNVSTEREPIVFSDELARLGDKLILITPEGACRIRKAPYYKELNS